jgi:hypothetical protein
MPSWLKTKGRLGRGFVGLYSLSGNNQFNSNRLSDNILCNCVDQAWVALASKALQMAQSHR